MNQLNLFPKSVIEEKTKQTEKEGHILSSYSEKYTAISWQQLIKKVLVALRVPFISAKHQLITYIKNYLKTKPFPWFRLALVLLFLYVFFQKDMHFNINMGGSPATSIEREKDRNVSKLAVGNFASTTQRNHKKIAHIQLADADVAAYIERFKKVALVEMEKFGIPASIKMGQALLASQAGKNSLSKQLNNHFAVACNGGENCQQFSLDGQTTWMTTYQSAWESWRHHSTVLIGTSYVHLQNHHKNYKKWAIGLEKAGYGGTNYSDQLIAIIEQYELYQLDNSL